MPTPFADLEDRVNSAIAERMANAVATWTPSGGGPGDAVVADVIVPLPFHEITDAGTHRVVNHMVCKVDVFPAAAPRDGVLIDGVDYVVRAIEPDGPRGLKRLDLARNT
jgi:hypothetical protein